MSWLGRLFGRAEKRSTVKSSDPYLAEFFGQRDTGSGGIVSPHLAENLSVVFACVQVIAETVAMLPARVYRRDADGSRAEAVEHPVARLFSGDANGMQTASELVEMLTALCLLRGNGYAEIVRDRRGAPMRLLPLHPDRVSVIRVRESGRIAYDVAAETGGTRRLLAEDVLHLRDRSDDGIVGKSRLARAREAFGTALAVERYAGSTFRHGAAMSGVLSHPDALGDEAAERLRKSFEATYSGTQNAGRVAVLEEGLKWTQVSVSPDDAQMLESRRFGVENLARIFRVPPPILGDYSSGNYASIVEIHRIFYSHCIQPWLNRWERLIERSLFSAEGRRLHEVEFDADLLVRADYLTRLQGYRIGREIGLYSANDLRRFENLTARSDPEGDVFLAPMNMASEQTGRPIADRGGNT